jgi:argininosuccinate lyase
MAKTWTGRFKKKLDADADRFNASISFDKKLFKYDVACGLAHTKALAKAKIITKQEAAKMASGLKRVLKKEKTIDFNEYEDVHSAVEMELVKLIGETGKKLHTGRSRNDLVATDTRLFVKDEITTLKALVKKLMKAIVDLAAKNTKTYMPGYTHMQQAQVITAGHWLMAYYSMLKRDLETLECAYSRVDVMPLGSGALAGSNYPIDRNLLAKELGFARACSNSIDGVADRDFLPDFCYFASMTAMHLSRMAEEIIIFNTIEFSFIEIDDSFATGSSIMPQKKNPDIAELIRGKAGRFFGGLMASLTLTKGLPLAYNKDLQEDKVILFRMADEIKEILFIAEKFLRNLHFKQERTGKHVENSFVYAVDVADYLVKKGVPFRSAHEATGKLVSYCIAQDKGFADISLAEAKEISGKFGEDIFRLFNAKSSVNSKLTDGSTSEKEVLKQIAAANKFLRA